MDELIFDYKRVEDVCLRCRREIGKKYGLETGNRKEIQKVILIKLEEMSKK